MKQVSVREFRLNLKRYLSELPIEVVNRGKPVAIVQKASQSVHKEENVHTSLNDVYTNDTAISDKPLPGYKFSSMLGKYVKGM